MMDVHVIRSVSLQFPSSLSVSMHSFGSIQFTVEVANIIVLNLWLILMDGLSFFGTEGISASSCTMSSLAES